MTLKEQIEQDLGLPVGAPTASACAVTGEPYLTIVIGGIKPEGLPFPQTRKLEDEAIQAYCHSVRGYCQMVTAGNLEGYTLYWRQEPEIENAENGQVRVYSRMLISNKPPLEKAA